MEEEAPQQYTVKGLFKTLGLVQVQRDGELLLMDFLTDQPTEAVQFVMPVTNARAMQATLRGLADQLERALAAAPSSDLH